MYHTKWIFVWYIIVMAGGIVWADSAARHGIDQLDVIHAMVNHYHHAPEYDDPPACPAACALICTSARPASSAASCLR